MQNYDKYKDELIDLLESNEAERICLFRKRFIKEASICDNAKEGEIIPCCICNEGFGKWLRAEYVPPKIDWSKVPINTEIHVRDSDDDYWYSRRYIGRTQDGKFIVYSGLKFDPLGTNKGGTELWRYAKLDASVDPTPYLKGSDKEC